MSSNLQRTLIILTALSLILSTGYSFTFREILVTAASYTVNVTTTYTFSY